MAGPVFIKLGGSLITRKDKRDTIDWEALRAAVGDVARVFRERPVLLGHGGGGFAHPVVAEMEGGDPWRLLAECQRAMRRLNSIVVDALIGSGVPAVSYQTSVFLYESRRGLESWVEPLRHLLLGHRVVPVVYGECLFSEKTVYRVVSTEEVFLVVAERVRPERIVLATNVGGVYTCDPLTCSSAELIPVIDRSNYEEVMGLLGGSAWRDVTGGMRAKVKWMIEAARRTGAEIVIVSGREPGNIYGAAVGKGYRGTLIRW